MFRIGELLEDTWKVYMDLNFSIDSQDAEHLTEEAKFPTREMHISWYPWAITRRVSQRQKGKRGNLFYNARRCNLIDDETVYEPLFYL